MFGAAVTVFLLHAVQYLYFFVDDEGIPYVIAQNILGGHGILYNPQDGRVEGYNDFLHVWIATVILACVRAIRANPLTVFFIGKAISLAAGAGVVWLMVRFLERMRLTSAGALVAGLGFVVLAGPFAVWSASSLETTPFALLVVLLAYALADERKVGPKYLAAAAGIALIVERIDGFVYIGALVAAFFAVADAERRQALWRRVIAPIAIAFVAYHGWRVAYFHALLPPSIGSKVLFKLQRSATLVLRVQDQNYAVSFLTLFLWLPGVATAVALILRGRGDRRVIALAGAAGLLTIYLGLVGDWMFGFRFFTAVVPVFGVLIAWCVDQLAHWRAVAARAATLAVVVILVHSAYVFEQSYERYQVRPDWLAHPSEGLAAYFPFYDLQRALRERIRPGDTLACNLGGFVPFMVGAPNIDNLGLCTRIFAEIPTTDVIYTEVGRYSPMTAKSVLRASDAYLLFRDPAYIVEPGNWIRGANGGRLPPTIFGGRYRLVDHADLAHGLAPGYAWCLFQKAASLDEFRLDPSLYLQNLAHVSSVLSVRVDGHPVSRSDLLDDCPYLREEDARWSMTGHSTIELHLSRAAVPVYEIFIANVVASGAAQLTISLRHESTTVYQKTIDLGPGQPVTVLDRLTRPVDVTHALLFFSSQSPRPLTIHLNDLRVQGQTPALAAFVSRRIGVPATVGDPK